MDNEAGRHCRCTKNKALTPPFLQAKAHSGVDEPVMPWRGRRARHVVAGVMW